MGAPITGRVDGVGEWQRCGDADECKQGERKRCRGRSGLQQGPGMLYAAGV